VGDDRLRPVWDFADLDGTERRFLTLMEDESESGRAEILTQLARVEGLRGAFAAADALLDDAGALAGSTPVVATRVLLERGRVRRSSGEVEKSLPLFESALAAAEAEGAWFIAADAAHMAAIAAPDRDGMLAWTQRGIDLAETHEGARYWLGPLLNNVGWTHYDAGDHELALDAFSKALEVREQAGDPTSIHLARHAVGTALRALERPAEAAAELEQAVAWAEAEPSAGADVRGWIHEELAEDYAALGRDAEAREQARVALQLLETADPAFSEDAERVTRMRLLAGA
jgi:tetratricopeptide (TPR) repeat protein